MDVGVAIFPTDRTIEPHDFARAAEERGFESVWFPEHSHIPVAEPGLPDLPPMPEMYRRCLDQFGALAAAAVATTRIRLGTGICLLVQRDPIHTAKEVATVDLLSGGRLLFGVGGGWNRTEMANHGTDARTRFQLLEERLEAMKVIWRDDVAEYHGRFVDFGPLWQWPKPVQHPHPPVLIGGNSAGTLRRVVDHADGWIPNAASPARLQERMDELQRLAAEAGRGPVPVTLFGSRPDAASLRRFAGIGAARTVVFVEPRGADDVLRDLDALSQAAAEARE